MKLLKIPALATRTRAAALLVAFAVAVPVLFDSNCDSNTGTNNDMNSLILAAAGMATITVLHDSAELSGSVEHIHYYGYDASGKLVYTSPAMQKFGQHTLLWVPRGIVLLNAVFHSAGDATCIINSYTVDFSGTSSLTVSTPTSSNRNFDPSKVALVCTVGGNLLVRGNIPLISTNGDSCLSSNQWRFAYSELDLKMKDLVPGFNLDDYEFIDFSLINMAGDKSELDAEANAVGWDPGDVETGWPPSNPAYMFITKLAPQGQNPYALFWWPILPCGTYPCNASDGSNTYDTGKWDFKELPGQLATLLAGSPAAPKTKRLIYVHCMHGADRTGTAIAGYLMYKDANLTLKDAFDQVENQLNPAAVVPCGDAAVVKKYCDENNPGKCDQKPVCN